MAAPKSPAPSVEYQSDRLRLLAPFITDRIRELALRRVIFKEPLFTGDKLAVGLDKPSAVIALLLVLEINPREELSTSEDGLVMGLDRKTVGRRRAA